MNIQSQSFPDLSRKGDARTAPYMNDRQNYKSSKLPVASRYVNQTQLRIIEKDKYRSTPNHHQNSIWKKFIVCYYNLCYFSIPLNTFCYYSLSRSRFPSMESNIEARNTSSNADSNYFINNNSRSVYSNNRLNGSLPRKHNTNIIPIRNSYFNYSHGKF